MTSRTLHRGFTLIEALIASVVLSMAVVAISTALMAGHMNNSYSLHAQRASRLAEEMLEYICSMNYADPQNGSLIGKSSTELTRFMYDNIGDWQPYSDGPGGLTDMANVAYPNEYQVFKRDVSVWTETVTVSGLGSITGLWVKVTVTDKLGKSWEARRFVPSPV
jgi:prepilin-type N-terminal cleavage/methylation domain-containing protein